VDLKNAERGRLTEYVCPGGGVELAVAIVEHERIGTVRTTERAAMGEFREQPERPRKRSGALRSRQLNVMNRHGDRS
jgi:hypothetical protein